jgi:hypothetical protein
MGDTSVRISEQAYSNLVKARGMLETFHEGRLSLDDAVFISTRFTYEVTRLLMKEMGENVVFTSGIGGRPETGMFLGPDGTEKYRQKFMVDLMDLTRLLLRQQRKEATHK